MRMQVLDQDYDWVFGSDLTYSEDMLPTLAKLLRQLVLTGESSVVKLAHQHRNKDLDRLMREAFHGESLLYTTLTLSMQAGLHSTGCW